MPPKRNAEEPSEAKIVTELAKEFNVDEVYGSESSFIGSLKSMNDFNPVEVPSNTPLNFDTTMLEVSFLSEFHLNTIWHHVSTLIYIDHIDDMQEKEPLQGNVDDEHMESGEEDENASVKEKSVSSKQNEKLYAEEGMLNTKLRKAEKKRRKKDNQSSTAMEHDRNDEDYDFKVDYVEGSAMETGDEVVADQTIKNRFELPSGAELDNE